MYKTQTNFRINTFENRFYSHTVGIASYDQGMRIRIIVCKFVCSITGVTKSYSIYLLNCYADVRTYMILFIFLL